MNLTWLNWGLIAYGVIVIIFTIFAVVVYVQSYAKKEKKVGKGKTARKKK